MTLKEQIVELRNQNFTYRQIEAQLGCSRSVIAYHLNATSKLKSQAFQNRNRYLIRDELRKQAGGCCQICGYSKCQSALEFHHKDESLKAFNITDALYKKKVSPEVMMQEIAKCILLCANCHREVHEGMTSLPNLAGVGIEPT